jgi:hypothetical protein
MTEPKNVAWFELLIYLALTLDALSVAVEDHTPTAASPRPVIMANAMMAASLILLQVYFVWLAGRRKKWPHFALMVPLVMTVFFALLRNRTRRLPTWYSHRGGFMRTNRSRAISLVCRRCAELVHRLIALRASAQRIGCSSGLV